MRTIVNIDVPDVKAAVDFYCAALGLSLSRMLDDETAELSGASNMIYLLQKPAGSAAAMTAAFAATRHYGRHWTPMHLDFVVEDLAAGVERALRAGAKAESECVIWRGSRCISFSDPFGHGFCLIEFDDGTYDDT